MYSRSGLRFIHIQNQIQLMANWREDVRTRQADYFLCYPIPQSCWQSKCIKQPAIGISKVPKEMKEALSDPETPTVIAAALRFWQDGSYSYIRETDSCKGTPVTSLDTYIQVCQMLGLL